MTFSPLRPYAAYLRVYEPLTAFPAEDREAWKAYAESAPSRAERMAAEHRRALVDVVRTPPLPVPPDESSEAFILEVHRELLVCPVQSRLRAWVAFGELRESLPGGLLSAFLPPPSVQRAEADHDVWGGKETSTQLRILTATWAVPVHWFVGFSADDREVSLAGPDRAVVYRARMSAARRRVGRALRTLRRTVGEVDYVDELEELGRWLEEFHARSWLELDYGGLAGLMSAEQLRADTSAADVASALEALGSGEPEAATAAYEALVERWSEVRAYEHAN